MERCEKCKRDESKVKLVDAIYDREIVKICEECALLEELPVIRRPSSFQLEASEKPYSVRQRLARLAGVRLKDELRSDMKAQAGVCDVRRVISLDNLRKPRDYNKTLQDRQEIAKKLNKPLDLVDNWNWHIQMTRRNKKISLAQVAEVIGETEVVLKMIEKGDLVDDANRIISKLEQYFKINLRKSEFEKEQARLEKVKQPARILNFDKDGLKNITISDLKMMKDARETAEEDDQARASSIVWGKERSSKPVKEDYQESSSDSDIEIIDDE
ncbi:MAG: hypothetical protein KKB21_01280 [Nanoarchaeota archaeon]|nr:hypothetical protein [Nanoarchaeota archaeon]